MRIHLICIWDMDVPGRFGVIDVAGSPKPPLMPVLRRRKPPPQRIRTYIHRRIRLVQNPAHEAEAVDLALKADQRGGGTSQGQGLGVGFG